MHTDNWAQKAKEKGYRSRAVFKLEEILKGLLFLVLAGQILGRH